MSNGGSQEKPVLELSPTEEMRTVLRVPETVTLSDGRTIKMRKLKIRELLEFSDTLIVAFRTLATARRTKGATKEQHETFFVAQMARVLWEPLAGVMQRVVTAEFKYQVSDADADDALLILARFAKMHEKVKQAFFELTEAFLPQVAAKLRRALQDLSTSSLEQDTSGNTSGSSATKS